MPKLFANMQGGVKISRLVVKLYLKDTIQIIYN